MKIQIRYSSWGGNTKLVVQQVMQDLQKGWHEVLMQHVVGAEMLNLDTDVTILAAPTYDHGVLHTPMQRFLNASDANDLTWNKCAVIGLGDSKYDAEYTIESAKILEDFVTSHGGELIADSLRIHKSPVDQLERVSERVENVTQQ